MKKSTPLIIVFLVMQSLVNISYGQEINLDSAWKHAHKNVVRYNLSSALLFGIEKTFILGYERALSPNRSISINAGTIALPKVIDIKADSFSVNKSGTNNGINASIDYRFYLSKLNKYQAPRGVYIGPWYSYNSFTRENSWDILTSSSGQKTSTTETKMNIHSLGFELGYQFIFWKRLALDFVMIGPGFGLYNINSKFDSNLTEAEKEQLRQALTDVLTQKFPGMDIVLEDQELDAKGKLNVTSLGYRYVIHIGFNF
jgi:Protein of unknown function (DUF3575)